MMEQEVKQISGIDSIRVVANLFEGFVDFVKTEVHEDWVGKEHFATIANAYKYGIVMSSIENYIDEIKKLNNPIIYLLIVDLELGTPWQELVENYEFAEVLESIGNRDVRADLKKRNEERRGSNG